MLSRLNKIVLLLFFLPVFTFAQAPRSFTGEAATYLDEMELLLETSNKKASEELLKKFEPFWLEGKFTPTQQGTIMEMSNFMLKKRLKPFPDFSNYLQALMGFAVSGKDQSTFDNWHNSLEQMLTGTTRRFSDYLENCAELFAANTLYSSASTRWVAGSSQYKFEFDSVPRVVFPKMDLVCHSKNDSSVIYQIDGYYLPLRKTFIGRGGKLYWTRAGLEPTETFAELRHTVIDVTGTDWVSDSAQFYHRKYFKQALIGKITEKIIANVTVDNATYPRFQSYDLQLGIKELIKDADYLGGFSMHGGRMIGSGTMEEKAALYFKREGKPFLTAKSASFVVRPDRISSDNASVLIAFEGDSIYHPSIQFKYLSKDREVSVVREVQAGIAMPFFNSFHKMDMFVDAIYWKIDDPLMEFKMLTGQGESKMVMESANLYTDERYQKIQSIFDESPLYTIKKFAEEVSRDIYSNELARYLRTSEQQARSLLIFLANRGFVNYDFETDKATINEKLYYYLAARSNKTDYDKIEMESIISALPNAKLSLLNFDLDVEGVNRILLSDSQQVWVVPANQQIKLKRNRNFEFDGRVHAGRSDFFGKKFLFEYDTFKINLVNVDSIRLKVVSETEFDEKGNPKLIPLQSTLQNVSGVLYIDSMMNKSSRKNIPGYPTFTSDKESYVYYDKPEIFNSVYNRDKFYFRIDPFTIDSLDSFSAGGLQFPGDFESGIFPTIREVARIRPDYSFGFERNSPPEGYPMYDGKGTFHNHIDLSYKGLVGEGTIEFLSSVSESKEIIFFPDSTNMDNAKFDLNKAMVAGIGFPVAEGREVFINWQPWNDRMNVMKKTTNLFVYDKAVTLDGNLALTSKGLGGNGNAMFSESELFSKDFYFKQDAYGADTSDFKLKSDDAAVLAIETKNVKSKIDLVKRFGEFVSNGKGSFVSFPLNQYICFIAQFRWFIDKQEVEFGEDYKDNTKLNIEGSDFVSVHPGQDSLRWNAGLARYSLLDYLIKARKVKEILVADASIQPNDTATIVIERNAVMRPLYEARITANTSTKYHNITNAQVNVLGRKSYEANGEYAYTDPAGTKHLIRLDRIAIDTSIQTYANGVISDSINFQLSRNIQYKGKINIAAANPLLNFDGFARVNHDCMEKLPSSWFAFRSDIDPKGVTIPVNDARNENHDKLAAGIYFANDSSGFYGAFLSPLQRNSDSALVTANGFLSYNDASKTYLIGPEEKLKNADAPGNLVTINAACVMNTEGRMNLGVNLGQLQLMPAGQAVYNTNNDSLKLDIVLGLDFLFSEDALKQMSTLIMENSTLSPTKDDRAVWTRAMRTLIGTEKADKLISEFSLYGAPKRIPEELVKTLMITDLKLYWNRETQSYKSSGPIGIGFIGKTTISRMLKGSVEIQRKRGNDVLHIYLESDNATWWYFNYTRGILQAISSDSRFNDIIQELKPEKRVAESKGDKPPYEYMLSTDRRKAEFLRRFNNN